MSRLRNLLQFICHGKKSTPCPSLLFKSFLIMSNARSGSTFFQSTLAACGADGDCEFALRAYALPMPNQRFISSGITDIAEEIQTLKPDGVSIYGSKLTIPIYDYLTDSECRQILHACRNVHCLIHLRRNYWDLLKSNLSRGVAHDIDPEGRGLSKTSAMYKECVKASAAGLGADKPSVFVGLSEGEFKKYLLNLARNDFAFASAREKAKGLSVGYEELQDPNTFINVLGRMRITVSKDKVKDILERPLLRKLPKIPDSNIPFHDSLLKLTKECYALCSEVESGKISPKKIFKEQCRLIDQTFL